MESHLNRSLTRRRLFTDLPLPPSMSTTPYALDLPSSPPRRFIADLIPTILESHDHWWPRDYLRLSLVSLEWVGPVRRRLYACPSVRSLEACYRLARSLRENPALCTLVRGLDLRPVHEQRTWPVCEKEMASLRYLLSLDGIKQLTLGGELAVQAGRFLHSLGHPETITELHIEGNLSDENHCSRLASLEWDEVIAFKFPNLRKLRLSNMELDVIPPSIPYELGITELILENVDIVSGYLHHMLHQSWRFLDHLSVTTVAAEFDPHMYLMLRCCAPTLQTLTYQTWPDLLAENTIFSHGPESYPSLRRLYFVGVAVDYETLSLIGERCQSLEELSVQGRIIRVTPDEWTTFIRSSAPCSLRRLSAPGATWRPPFEAWSHESGMALRKVCAERSVELTYPLVPRVRGLGLVPSALLD